MSDHQLQPEKRPEDDPFAPGDELWDALGQAPKPEPDAWLATKTMARWRREQEEPASLLVTWFRSFSYGRVAFAGGTLAALALVFTLAFNPVSEPTNAPLAQAEPAETEAVLTSADSAYSVEALLAADEELDIFTPLPLVSEATEAVEVAPSGAPVEEALAYLADGQSGDVLFAEADWQ